MELQQCALVIKDKPYCYWDTNILEKNLQFIDGIDPTYFQKIAEMYIENLDGDNSQVAALSIRATYFHGLETMFSLLCATIQASYCVYGWLHHYDGGQLRSMVTSIQEYREIQTKLGFKKFSWNDISIIIHQFEIEDKEKEEKIKSSYGNLWKKLAKEFLDEQLRIEYNHIKHGFRVRPGGFHLSIGAEKEYGTPANPEDMKSMGGSEYGTSFFTPVEFESEDKALKKLHYQVEEQMKNWDPVVLAIRLRLISESINNILSFLKITNGRNPKEVRYIWPEDISVFDTAWEVKGGVFAFNAHMIIPNERIEFYTREELLIHYEKNTKTN